MIEGFMGQNGTRTIKEISQDCYSWFANLQACDSSGRGAHPLPASNPESQYIVIFGHHSALCDTGRHVNFADEMFFVLSRLGESGLRVELSYLTEDGYIILTTADPPIDMTKSFLESWVYTEAGSLALNECLASVNQLLWSAFRAETLPQLKAIALEAEAERERREEAEQVEAEVAETPGMEA